MARNGAGVYSNPYANFVNGTVISSDEADANNAAIGTALTQSIAVDGQTTITANLPMNSKKFTGLAVGTAATDSLTLGQAQAQAFAWGGTAGGGADAITISPTPAITAYAVGQKFFWIASGSANTGAATIAISGLTAIAMQDGGAALAAGVHAAGKVFMGVLNTTSTVQILEIKGNTEVLSSLTVNGASQFNGTITQGVDGTGYDLKLFGDTSGAYLMWDQSADKLLTAGGALVDIVKDKLMIGGTAVTTTAAELNFNDTATAGTVVASKTVVASADKDIASFRNITLTGELDAGSLDISGIADIAGTTTVVALTASGIVTANAKIDLNGTELILDADADTSITADTDDRIDFKIGGTDKLTLTAAKASLLDVIASLTPTAGDVLSFPTPTTAAGRSIPGRNLIQNGDFKVNQRGSTTVAAGASGIGPDRFSATSASTAAYTLTSDADVPAGQGLHKSLKVDITTGDASIAAGEAYYVEHRIEGTNVDHLMLGSANAVNATVQFWARSRVTGIHCVALVNGANSRSYPFEYTIAVADTWEYFTKTIALDQAGAWLTTTGIGLRLIWNLGSGANFQGTADTWEAAEDLCTSNQVNVVSSTGTFGLAGVQLEVGSVATDFEHEDYGTTRQKCLRYYEQLDFDSVSAELVSLCNIWDATLGAGIVEYQVEKRATPTATFTAAGTFLVVEGDGTTQAPGAVYASGIGTRSLKINCGLTSAGTGAGELRRDGTDVCNIKITAEL